MIKKAIFISILLLVSIGTVAAFEVPPDFEHEFNIYDKGQVYTNSYGDEDSGQVIEILLDEEYNDEYYNDYENYSYSLNGDGTFDFTYLGENMHSGIGKSYGRLTVLFWNKDMSANDDNLKELIAQCDELNGES